MVPSVGNFGEIWTKLEKISFRKMRLKMSVTGDPYSSGLRLLRQTWHIGLQSEVGTLVGA